MSGKNQQPPGTWSDDTSLTLATIIGLCDKGRLERVADEFINWFDYAAYTPGGCVFDIGNVTKEAIIRLKEGASLQESGGTQIYENGNGSIMRMLPAVFYLRKEKNIEKRKIFVYELSGITHAHERTKIACHIFVEFALRLLAGDSIQSAYDFIVYEFSSMGRVPVSQMEKRTFSRIMSGELNILPREYIESDSYVAHTLQAALWCLLTTDNYREAVLTAVNLGDDTDTTGAVTGGLAGLYYGYEQIPEDWIKTIVKKEMIFDAVDKLYQKCYKNIFRF